MTVSCYLRYCVFVLCFTFITVAHAAAGPGNGKPEWLLHESPDAVTIRDDGGARVTVKKEVKTIVALGAECLGTIVRVLKSENRVVGISDWIVKYKTLLPVLSRVKNIVRANDATNYERIYELNPDLVLLPHYMTERVEDKLRPHMAVARLKVNNLESITKFGKLLGRETAAKAYVEWILSKTRVIEERTKTLGDGEIKEAFFYYGGDFGMSPPPPYGTYGKDNTLVNGAIKKAGGRSISWALPGDWVVVDPEWIIERNPSTIIREYHVLDEAPAMGYGVNDTTKIRRLMGMIISSPAFATCDAVKNRNVHICSGLFIQSYWFIGMNYYAKWFHPDLFRDIDPGAIHQEFITQFMRLDFNVGKQGVFVYSSK